MNHSDKEPHNLALTGSEEPLAVTLVVLQSLETVDIILRVTAVQDINLKRLNIQKQLHKIYSILFANKDRYLWKTSRLFSLAALLLTLCKESSPQMQIFKQMCLCQKLKDQNLLTRL